MEEIIEQEKHEIAVLTENTLYNRIRGFDEDSNLDEETREQLKNETINAFLEYCTERYKTLTLQQIKEHVLFKLNKTIDNIKRLKEDEER